QVVELLDRIDAVVEAIGRFEALPGVVVRVRIVECVPVAGHGDDDVGHGDTEAYGDTRPRDAGHFVLPRSAARHGLRSVAPDRRVRSVAVFLGSALTAVESSARRGGTPGPDSRACCAAARRAERSRSSSRWKRCW